MDETCSHLGDEPLKQSRLRAARILHSRSMPDPLMIKSTFHGSDSSAASFWPETSGAVKRLWAEGEQVETMYLSFTAFQKQYKRGAITMSTIIILIVTA